ncbi:MAG: DUF4350 domain-containing protein [Bacteroidota bacterium]
MSRSQGRTYLVIVTLIALLLTLQVVNKEKEISWEESYARTDKIPYGTYVLFERLQDLFDGRKAVVVSKSPYAYLVQEEEEAYETYYEYDEDSSFYTYSLDMLEGASYVFINQNFYPDDESINTLLTFTSYGNQVFIATESMDSRLEDSLRIHIVPGYFDFFTQEDSLSIQDSLDSLGGEFLLEGEGFTGYVESEDTLGLRILIENHKGEPTLVQIPYGEGNFYISSVPLAFTNYHMLDSLHMARYVAQALSYLPRTNEVLWDEYYKEGNIRRRKLEEHPLQFIYSQPSLKWAFLLSIVGMLIYMVFESKRKTPIVPLKDPFANTSLEFIETIGRLYFQRGNHKNLLEKKVKIFLSEVYHRFGIPTDELNDAFIQQLAHRTGISADELKEGVIVIQKIRQADVLGEKEFTSYYEGLDAFSREVLG